MPFSSPFFKINNNKSKKIKRKKFSLRLDKRQKFITSVIVLSIGLFIAEYLFTKYGFYVSFFLAALTDILFAWSLRNDIKNNFFPQIFILPFLYSLSFGLFYFLAPSRLITRVILTSVYAVGLYSLFLSENIFTVASIRTIALLNSARIVSFVITLINFFFFTNIIFSLHASIFLTSLLFFIMSFSFIFYSIWTYTLEKNFLKDIVWVSTISFSIFEVAVILWFWPTTPTVLALFLTGAFYILVGLSHVWLEKRLFRGVLWEYVWVAIFSFFILIWFTRWQ